MKYLIIVFTILITFNCRKNNFTKNSSITYDFQKEKEYLYKKINNLQDSITSKDYENFFCCTYTKFFDGLTLVSLTYSKGYDNKQENYLIISENIPGIGRKSYYLKPNYSFLLNHDESEIYKSSVFDSVINHIQTIHQIDYKRRKQIIKEMWLTYTLGSYRMYKNQELFGEIYNISLSDVYELNNSSLPVFEALVLDSSNLNIPFLVYQDWKKNYSQFSCIGDSAQEYHDIIQNIKNERVKVAEEVNEYTDYSKHLIADSMIAYIKENLSNDSLTIYYTLPDFQLFEMKNIGNLSFGIKWLYPKVHWEKTYIPLTQPAFMYSDESKPMLVK